MTLRINAIPYHVKPLSGWVEHEARLDPLLEGCDLAILPEYAGMEAALMGTPRGTDPVSWCQRAAEREEEYAAQLAHLAKKHGCWICGATMPAATDRGIVNRGFMVAPWGEVHHQDKLILTPYERDPMGMVPGQGLTVIDTVFGKFGMLICYDSEFPLLSRALAEAGCDMILVPSCTDLMAGQTRVRQSCRARAIEQQCLVVHVPLVGDVPECDVIDRNTGRAGFFVPPDHGMPPDGILAQGEMDVHGVVSAEVDFMAVSAARRSGQTRNHEHWAEQGTVDTRVTVLAL